MNLVCNIWQLSFEFTICHTSFDRDCKDLFTCRLRVVRYWWQVHIFKSETEGLFFNIKLPFCRLGNDRRIRVVARRNGWLRNAPVVTGRVFGKTIHSD